MKIVFVADFFSDEVNGGGELNNEELIRLLSLRGNEVIKVKSHFVTQEFILRNKQNKFIIANFANLQETAKKSLISSGCTYIIYEHDHKYLFDRNPGVYPNYQAPQNKIINKDFYASANAVLCQSNFHSEIVRKNLFLDNIYSLGGNLWSESQYELFCEMNKTDKSETYAIMNSIIAHKNTHEAVRYCEALKLEYSLIDPNQPNIFLRELGKHSTLVFFPKTPETLSRIVVEARMMGMKIKTTKNIGAIHEQWFEKKGLDLIEYMRYTKEKEIINIVLDKLNE